MVENTPTHLDHPHYFNFFESPYIPYILSLSPSSFLAFLGFFLCTMEFQWYDGKYCIYGIKRANLTNFLCRRR